MTELTEDIKTDNQVKSKNLVTAHEEVFSTIEIVKPNEICTETYIIVGSFNSENECLNLLSYLKTKFTRFLVSQLSFSQDITKDRFAFVPIESFQNLGQTKKLLPNMAYQMMKSLL